MKKPKVVVVMPAHNAAMTLAASYKRLPQQYIDEVILVDDASNDKTLALAKKLGITTYRNNLNLGYGGNLKVCLTKALEKKADIIIEYHPDNQYDPKNLPEFLEKVNHGFDFGLGSRFVHPKEALKRNMPVIKFIANRSLTFIEQFILGIELTEFHSGFRLYTRKFLESVPYLQNSDDYLFSFEIIVQAVFYKFKIAEIQVACDYHPQMHTANLYRSTIYAIGTFKTLIQYVRSKFLSNPTGPFVKIQTFKCLLCKQQLTRREYQVEDAVSRKTFFVNFCAYCRIGSTWPQPKNLGLFYPKTYYSKIKSFIYRLLQYRRPQLIHTLIRKGKLLDIGCGDGTIAYQLGDQFDYVGIETPFAKISNPRVKNVGIEGMHEKNNSYDLVTFWESFEHVANPIRALHKSVAALKKEGYLIIECPNFASWERLPFNSRWFHLDPPRHLFHYTPAGLKNLVEQNGFTVVRQALLYAPEYIPVGLAQSLLYRISPKLNVFAQNYQKKGSFTIPLLVIIFSIIFFPFSYIFYLLNGSPIQLLIAQKK